MKWNNFSGILFDLDGLLLDSESVSRDCWELAASAQGLSMTDFYPELLGRGTAECDRIIADRLGPSISITELRARKDALQDRYIATNGIRLRPGAHNIVNQAKLSSLRIALATGSSQEAAAKKFTGHSIQHLFDVKVYGGDVSRGKPAPDIFLLAAERLGVAPSECIVLEDSIAGMTAAQAANMRAIVVPDLIPIDKQRNSESVLVVDSLFDAARVLGLDTTIAVASREAPE
jgi:HAD superfamily hydrolase (TIGR01509 family)